MDESGQIPYWSDNPPERVRAGQKFVFRRSGWDVAMREHCPDVGEGDIVRVIQLPSAPKPGTMGQVHIEDANTGEFLGMCSMKSLSTPADELEAQRRGGKKNPPGRTVFDIIARLRVWLGVDYVLMNSHAASLSKDNVMTILGLVEQDLERDMPGADIQVSLSPQPKGHFIEFDLASDAPKGKDAHIWKILDLRIKYHLGKAADALIDIGEEDNPESIHIDIGSHNAAPGSSYEWSEKKNPPLVVLSDREAGDQRIIHYRVVEPMKSATDAARVLETWFPQWRVVSNYSLKAGSYPKWKYVYGAEMRRRPKMNPPLPASALLDVSTAKTVAREVEEGLRPMGSLGTVDHLLDRGLQKLRGSHLGNVDWQNPGPGKIKYYNKRTQPLSRHNVVKAIEQLIEANTEVGNTLAMFKRRGMVSDEEYLEWKYVQQIAMMLRDDLTLATGSEMTNPPTATEIYKDIIEIRAMKPNGQRYVHKFKPGSNIYGLPNGNILIQSRKGKRLWKNFKLEA